MVMDKIALLLVIIGAVNWGLIGIFQFDLVASIFGGQAAVVSRIIYTLVGAAGLWCISLLFRDRENLTPGVRHTFLIAGLAYGLRRALLDEMTITEGVEYERYVAEWLAQNPGKTRLDVPQLTVDLRGARIVVPGDVASEYQIRVPVTSVEEMHIQNEKIYMLIVEFGLNTPNPLRFPLYAPERVCKIVPQAGDEIDAIIWLQGRIID